MKLLWSAVIILAMTTGCKSKSDKEDNLPGKELSALFEQYYEEYLQLFPLEATFIGDKRYNHLLPIDFTDSYREKYREFLRRYLTELKKYESVEKSGRDQTSYDVMVYDLEMFLEELKYPDNYFPFHQMFGMPLTLAQLGSGSSYQPFKTVKDYNDWLQRASGFPAWADSAISYFKKGFNAQFVFPKAIVEKLIPQMEAIPAARLQESIFYSPIHTIPAEFSEADKKKITGDYAKLIKDQLEPAYKKLGNFLKRNYLLKARTSSGIGSLPGGEDYYRFLVKKMTTTDKSPQDIYEMGLAEVARIRQLMDSVKQSTGFTGDLPSFFEYMKTDKKFTPFKTPRDVLDAFEKIHQVMEPYLKKMFNRVPITPFEIRQTEAFRAESASAEYHAGAPDGSRPGIFYVPILDATTFSVTSGMESLFLHEAIPGHHYQISLQQEDTSLPRFRRFGGYSAYAEGWALYCESLGKELGLYTDPYQYMGALGDEMHRAIRLVVDVAIHLKGMTREEAIKYMMANEAISEQGATAEIERYMVMPGQALAYKIGALKIAELRAKYVDQSGGKVSLAEFHDEVLKHGALPLTLLEKKLDEWAKSLKHQ